MTFTRSLLLGVEGLYFVFTGPLPRVGVVVTPARLAVLADLDTVAGLVAVNSLATASLIGFGLAGLTNVFLKGLSGPVVSRDLLGIFFPGWTNPELFALLVILGALVLLGIAAPAAGTFWSSGRFVRRFVSGGFLTCEGSAEATADVGSRLFSFDRGLFTTYICTYMVVGIYSMYM